MLLDDEINNVVVATYRGVILYSLYMNDGVYCRISSVSTTKRYKPPILHEDRRSYYWKNTYTYGLRPPGPKKAAPKEKTTSKVSLTLEDFVIPMEESSPRSSSIKLSSPKAPIEVVGPYEGPRSNMREHLHETPVKEEKRDPWEPCRHLKGVKLMKGQNLCQSDFSVHLLSEIVLLRERRPLQYDPQWFEGVVRCHLTHLTTVNSFPFFAEILSKCIFQRH